MDNSESGVDISGSFEGSSFQEDDAQSLTNEARDTYMYTG